jgi:hypothetical protein
MITIIYSTHKDQFLDFAEAVYGFKCELPDGNLVEVFDPQTNKNIF